MNVFVRTCTRLKKQLSANEDQLLGSAGSSTARTGSRLMILTWGHANTTQTAGKEGSSNPRARMHADFLRKSIRNVLRGSHVQQHQKGMTEDGNADVDHADAAPGKSLLPQPW